LANNIIHFYRWNYNFITVIMTLQEHVYEFRLIVRQLNLYDDDKLDDRLIKNWLHNQRALWIRNEMNKPRSVDEQIIQTLGAVPLEIADRSSHPSFLTGYTVLQTSVDIPKVIELSYGDGILELGPVDKLAYPFAYVNLSHARFAGSGKFNKNMIYAFRHGLRILIFSRGSQSFHKYLRYIRIRGVFENPEEVGLFTHVDGTPCYNDTFDYPLNRWMWNFIRDKMKEANFNLIVAAPTDKENDSSETLKTAVNEKQ